ncbi:MAG: hypothetical protein WD333_11940 [Dehalococcoidia bacterium]
MRNRPVTHHQEQGQGEYEHEGERLPEHSAYGFKAFSPRGVEDGRGDEKRNGCSRVADANAGSRDNPGTITTRFQV